MSTHEKLFVVFTVSRENGEVKSGHAFADERQAAEVVTQLRAMRMAFLDAYYREYICNSDRT